MAFEKLFSPIKIRGLELRNRVVMSAMGTAASNASEDGRMVTDKLIAFHAARAKGGCGLNTTECCSVDHPSAPAGFLAISDDKYIPGMTRLCDAVHAEGGKIALQLWQGAFCVAGDPAAEVLLPDECPCTPEYIIPAMTVERIQSVIEAFGTAARRGVVAGFDVMEFHCGHNYLPHYFLSPAFNFRTDEWGGSLENRMRFPLECLRSIRANIPEDMPLFMRVVWQDDFVEGGLTAEDVIEFCKRAKEVGVDVINVSRGNVAGEAVMYEVPPVDLPNGFNVEPAARIRREAGVMVMPCGRINTPELAEQILQEDKADLVVMARAQLADAEFCNKAKAGQLSSIKYCIGCDQGCYDYFVKCGYEPGYEHVTCLRNPALLEEATKSLTKTDSPKKVLVAGGGIGGIETADALFKRGHHPILCEKGDTLGGQFVLAGAAPRKSDFAKAAKMAAQNIIDEGVEIRMNTPVTPELIAAEKPDAVVIAIGSSPIIPRIPGADGEKVFGSHKVLAGAEIPVGKAVVIGGGLVGMEVAEFLCARGSSVTVVEMKDSILGELGQLRLIGTQLSLAEEPVTTLLNTTCKEIKDNAVVVETDGVEQTLEADFVVMAIGSKPVPSDDLQVACESANIPYYVIGDALQAPRLALNAIHEGYKAALSI